MNAIDLVGGETAAGGLQQLDRLRLSPGLASITTGLSRGAACFFAACGARCAPWKPAAARNTPNVTSNTQPKGLRRSIIVSP